MTDSPPREACETMIALANERGGEDNETVIVADVLGEDLNEPMEFETVTSTFEVMQAFEARPNKPRRRTPPLDAAPVAKPVSYDSDPEIEVLPTLDAAAAEPAAGEAVDEPESAASKHRGWVTSLLSRLSRGQKR
jgi:hypothetical protein